MKDGEPCLLSLSNPTREALNLLADKWSLLVLFALRNGTRRFTELHREIEAITQKMLIQTLRTMERDGLVERTVYPVAPPKVEYRLSSLGRSFTPLLLLLGTWTEEHLADVHAARSAYDRQTDTRGM